MEGTVPVPYFRHRDQNGKRVYGHVKLQKYVPGTKKKGAERLYFDGPSRHGTLAEVLQRADRHLQDWKKEKAAAKEEENAPGPDHAQVSPPRRSAGGRGSAARRGRAPS
uniref:Uncharacterized protein n=1 Tax=Chromera velia CCMP2878 TaxID=1169474 RepID=A0A0G4FP83_9ALVE|mmetsp:Transcript_437/g.979  ORF Transcript_437/g.979 Transcript_437/m.979 type:complete len:109 (+) Transcript_437:1436-1762(+)|eukprot:Cvel_18043.t1-p1 / transcript=Cvel_18043.t1 / gene=Cvel_18043 / organism=Chromera_velia_CCMP2878 / gene_product=hypothetical protein / transcript_product=hypothetical protein / location=Cvel_scaffold1473:39320-39643(-) / protein_length=108 / sequence_SO=supercontig / SO=protein_coding / is_pseudo=false